MGSFDSGKALSFSPITFKKPVLFPLHCDTLTQARRFQPWQRLAFLNNITSTGRDDGDVARCRRSVGANVWASSSLRKVMNLEKILADLHDEKRRIDEAINALERISAGRPRRRGRPPRWLQEQRLNRTEPVEVSAANSGEDGVLARKASA
jgi:hypothetical protein